MSFEANDTVDQFRIEDGTPLYHGALIEHRNQVRAEGDLGCLKTAMPTERLIGVDAGNWLAAIQYDDLGRKADEVLGLEA